MTTRTAPPTAPFAHLSLPAENIITYPNGSSLHYISGGDQPIARLSLCFDGGIAELGNINGLMAGTQLVDGCEGLTADQIAEELDFNGARFSARLQQHNLVLDINMLNHRAEAVLDLVAKIIAAPLYPADRLATAKLRAATALQHEMRQGAFLADRALAPLIYGPKHPSAIATSQELIDAATPEILSDIFRRIKNPAHIHAYLSGLLSDELIEAVGKFLCSIQPTGDGVDIEITPFLPAPEGTTVTVENPGALQSAIAMGMPTIGRQHPDYINLRLTVMALGGYFGSRLMKNIREDKGLTYGISAQLLGNDDGAALYIAARTDKSFTDQVISEIHAQMLALADNPPCDDELERLKLYASSTLAEILDSPRAIISHYLGRRLAGIPDGYFDRTQDAIAALTPDIIADMARKHLRPQALRTAISQ